MSADLRKLKKEICELKQAVARIEQFNESIMAIIGEIDRKQMEQARAVAELQKYAHENMTMRFGNAVNFAHPIQPPAEISWLGEAPLHICRPTVVPPAEQDKCSGCTHWGTAFASSKDCCSGVPCHSYSAFEPKDVCQTCGGCERVWECDYYKLPHQNGNCQRIDCPDCQTKEPTSTTGTSPAIVDDLKKYCKTIKKYYCLCGAEMGIDGMSQFYATCSEGTVEGIHYCTGIYSTKAALIAELELLPEVKI